MDGPLNLSRWLPVEWVPPDLGKDSLLCLLSLLSLLSLSVLSSPLYLPSSLSLCSLSSLFSPVSPDVDLSPLSPLTPFLSPVNIMYRCSLRHPPRSVLASTT